MRITYTGTGAFTTDGETVTAGETFEVSDDRGAHLLERFPDRLERRATEPTKTPAQSDTGTASSDSTGD